MGAKTLKLTRRAALLRGRLERGELSEDRLALAAFLNDSAAQELVEYPEPPLREDEWDATWRSRPGQGRPWLDRSRLGP